MVGPFTRTLEFSRQLLRVYQTEGRETFLQLLTEHTAALIDGLGDQGDVLNSRLMTIVSGILSVLFISQTDEIIRQQVALSERFVSLADPAVKCRRFVVVLTAFLDDMDARHQNASFFDMVRYKLKSCTMPQLRDASVSALADALGYHPNYLSSKFKKEKGIGLQDVICHERLDRAMVLLQGDGQMSVQDVAHEVGFSDVKHFRKLFKHRFGRVPSEA